MWCCSFKDSSCIYKCNTTVLKIPSKLKNVIVLDGVFVLFLNIATNGRFWIVLKITVRFWVLRRSRTIKHNHVGLYNVVNDHSKTSSGGRTRSRSFAKTVLALRGTYRTGIQLRRYHFETIKNKIRQLIICIIVLRKVIPNWNSKHVIFI